MAWQAEYRAKVQTADDATACVQLGKRVCIQPGCGKHRPTPSPRALQRSIQFLAGEVEE